MERATALARAFLPTGLAFVLGSVCMFVALRVPDVRAELPALADFAQVAGVVLALLAAGVAAYYAYKQIQEARVSTDRQTTRGIYAEYLRLAIERDRDGERGPSDLVAAFMLMACEQVLAAYPGDLNWQNTVDAQLRRFRQEVLALSDDELAM